MKIFISESDRFNAFRVPLITISRFYGISDWEFKTNDVLIDEITAKNSPIIQQLNAYFDAYNKWFSFYQERQKIERTQGTEYILSRQEEIDLTGLIKNRKDTLSALEDKFAELQFDRLNPQGVKGTMHHE